MARIPETLSAQDWLRQIFTSLEARKGGIVKRQIRDVERLVGRDAFVRAVEKHGFQAIENNRHFIIFCNPHPIRRVAGKPLQSGLETRFWNRVRKAF